MNTIAQVLALIKTRGPSTVDDLMPKIKGATRKQVLAALANARATGRLIPIMRKPRAKRVGSGSYPMTYSIASETSEVVRPKLKKMPVNSVWDLGTRAAL